LPGFFFGPGGRRRQPADSDRRLTVDGRRGLAPCLKGR